MNEEMYLVTVTTFIAVSAVSKKEAIKTAKGVVKMDKDISFKFKAKFYDDREEA